MSLSGITFDDIWLRLSAQERTVCCTRSYGPTGWNSFIAWNPVASYVGNNIDAFRAFVAQEQRQNRRIFGYLSYDLCYSLFNITPHAVNDLNLPNIAFNSYDRYVQFSQDGMQIVGGTENFLTELLARPKTVPSHAIAPMDFTANTSPTQYGDSYHRVKQYIVEGDIYQLNLTHRLSGTTSKSPRALFHCMCQQNPVDCIAYMEGDGFEILSASPERFITISNQRLLSSYPIKGTRPRALQPVEDAQQSQELLASAKEQAELNMITDLIRNDIGKVAKVGSVHVLNHRAIQAYPTVWHTYSHICGTVLNHLRSVDALLSMFPGGSVTGCPKKRALEIIDELEPTMRGVYTGAIGFIDPDDSLSFNIAIRTLIKVGSQVYLQVGGGIVYDSKESDEYQETFDKAKSFLGIL